MIRMNSRHLSSAVILLMIMLAGISCKSTPKSPSTSNSSLAQTLDKADQLMQDYVDKGKLSGISILVLKDGKTAHQKTFGLANIEEEKVLEEESIFRIYSMSKPITAAALMMLYDEGKFKLDDPVSDYIPEFKNTRVWVDGKEVHQKEAFTVRHLLTHTAGFCYGLDHSHVDSLYKHGFQGGIWDTSTLENMMKVLAGFPLKNQPGTVWEYSVSIDVAGYLVEVLSGKPFDVFLQTRLFEPLGMDDTGFEVPEKDFNRVAMIYSEEKGSRNLTPVEDLQMA